MSFPLLCCHSRENGNPGFIFLRWQIGFPVRSCTFALLGSVPPSPSFSRNEENYKPGWRSLTPTRFFFLYLAFWAKVRRAGAEFDSFYYAAATREQRERSSRRMTATREQRERSSRRMTATFTLFTFPAVNFQIFFVSAFSAGERHIRVRRSAAMGD